MSEDAYDADAAAYEQDDIEDEGVLDASDTLDGDPGADPLDEGVIAADRWSAGMRYGSTEAEEEAGESLDQLLAEEEPDLSPDDPEDGAWPAQVAGDVDAADEDVDGLLLDDGPDPRAGRLVAEDEGAHSRDEPDLVARDAGIDGGAASAEEAAVHEVADDDTDIRSGD
ncbi:MAG TPA: DUF5709 domain-containing protein [Streptosporangiaceae bacterium]|nr:DUF5709 domain-containing protein [Streptosporangiaceae bacterium]